MASVRKLFGRVSSLLVSKAARTTAACDTLVSSANYIAPQMHLIFAKSAPKKEIRTAVHLFLADNAQNGQLRQK